MGRACSALALSETLRGSLKMLLDHQTKQDISANLVAYIPIKSKALYFVQDQVLHKEFAWILTISL